MFEYQIDFSDSEASDAARFEIERHLEKLARIHGRILNAHVSVRIPHRHHRKHRYQIVVTLNLPGKTLVVGKDTDPRGGHSDIKVAIRDAFNRMLRQLEDFVRQRAEPLPVEQQQQQA